MEKALKGILRINLQEKKQYTPQALKNHELPNIYHTSIQYRKLFNIHKDIFSCISNIKDFLNIFRIISHGD